MKTPSHCLFTLLLILFTSLASPTRFPAYAGGRPDASTARSEKIQTLASLPGDARAAITNSLRREGVLVSADFTEKAKLTASSGQAGSPVAVDGDTVVVNGSGFSLPGPVYVFVKPENGWASGVESATLVRSNGTLFNGASVAIEGDTIVVGAPLTFSGFIGQGQAYVYVKPAGGWVGAVQESATLINSDGKSYDSFGGSVGIKNDVIVAGATGQDLGGRGEQGSAYVFVKPVDGWTGSLTESAKLTASDGSYAAFFGASLAVGTDTVLVGANLAQPNFQGSAYIYLKPAQGWSGSHTENAKLITSDLVDNNINFGVSVGMDGDTVVVGADQVMDGADFNVGAAYVFVKPAGGWVGTLTQNARLSASDAARDDYFAHSVAIAGDTVVAGSPQFGSTVRGAAYVFVKPSSGWTGSLTESEKLTSQDGSDADAFGGSVAMDNDTVIVGASGAPAAYVFERNPSADISYVINYTYRFASGTRQSGTDTLLADGTFQDSIEGGGTWALTQAGRLTLQYQGALCNAFLSGRFKTPTKLNGTLRCTDGSGDTGTWQGTIVQQ